jgi:8-oxo-dGTP pyrophosphatase MutT (NUDIX family)
MTQLYCGNCGKIGHIYKNCFEPVISIGIICINFGKTDINNAIYEKSYNLNKKFIGKNIKYLVISRKNSIGYVEFMRGKYTFDDLKYLQLTLNIMTEKEQEYIKHKSFEENWKYLWTNNEYNRNNNYINSKKKFEIFKKSKYIKLLDNNKKKWDNPEWGFPKGRRNLRETDINCAKREFSEETNIKDIDYNILDMKPIEESYIGTNGIRYKHIYYIAQINKNVYLKIDKNNKYQRSEIGEMKWCNIKEVISLIRHYNTEKKEIITNIHNMLILALI